VLGGHAGNRRTRTANPAALDDSNFLAGPREMPCEQFAALAAAKDDDIEKFRLRHACFPQITIFNQSGFGLCEGPSIAAISRSTNERNPEFVTSVRLI